MKDKGVYHEDSQLKRGYEGKKEITKEDLAHELGVDSSEIKTRDMGYLYTILKAGVVAIVSIGRWRGKMKTTPELLGMDLSDKEIAEYVDQYISLGQNYLFPKEVLKKFDGIEQATRSVQEKYGYDIPVPAGKFIPVDLLKEWRKEIEALKEKYFDILQGEVLDKYDENVEKVVEDYQTRGALAAYRQFTGNHWASIGEVPQEFIGRFIEKIRTGIPSKELIEKSFFFDAIFVDFTLPSVIEEDLIKTERLSLERDSLVQLREMRRRKDEELVAAYGEEAEKKLREVVEGFTLQMLSKIYDVALDTLDAVEKNKRFISRSAVQIRNLIETVNKLNFFQDKTVDEFLAEIEKVVAVAEGNGKESKRKLDLDQTKMILERIGTKIQSILIEAGRPTMRKKREAPKGEVVPLETPTKRTKRISLGQQSPKMETVSRRGIRKLVSEEREKEEER
ncbi:MAG: DUF3150 domain-containing protein [Actinomycetota bacterium]|nr:DUF3150 domain-containing protein [Actinomycetota bacterium]